MVSYACIFVYQWGEHYYMVSYACIFVYQWGEHYYTVSYACIFVYQWGEQYSYGDGKRAGSKYCPGTTNIYF